MHGVPPGAVVARWPDGRPTGIHGRSTGNGLIKAGDSTGRVWLLSADPRCRGGRFEPPISPVRSPRRAVRSEGFVRKGADRAAVYLP
jgi:hypothetical protein